jgi:hypothetical protein
MGGNVGVELSRSEQEATSALREEKGREESFLPVEITGW